MSLAHSIRHFSRRDLLQLGAGVTALSGLATLSRVAFAQSADSVGSLKIATIGAGREGGTLGTLFAKAGHPVMFSSRHPEELKDLVAQAGPTASAGSVADAVEFGQVILVVLPYTAVQQIGQTYAAQLATKPLVLDVSNPIARRDGEEIVKWVEQQGGAGLATQKLLPGAHLVRAFNAIGAGKLREDAHREGERVGVPIAGDDPNAIALASRLIREIGFEPVLVGGLSMGRYLVPGTPLAGEHTPAQIRQIVAGLR